MRELSILAGVFILIVSVTGFTPNRILVGPAGLRRRTPFVNMHQHRTFDPEYVKVCQTIVSNQSAVLLLAESEDPREFACFKERYELDTLSSVGGGLPFVDRINTITGLTLAIIGNLNTAEQFQNGYPEEKRSLSLVGCGALFGAGKTTLGPVLYQCLEGMLARLPRVGKNRKMTYVMSEICCSKSTYEMWLEDVCSKPGMEGLLAMINKDMTFTQLVQATDKYLTNRRMVMFLHLDEFAPFDDAGPTENTPDNFYHCWQRMLMPILCSPSIGLYISGRTAYFDTIGRSQSGQSPCSVLSVQLDLFTTNIIQTILEMIFIPRNITGEETVSLSTALERLFSTVPDQMSPPQGSWALDVAQRLQDVTGGVPRFVEHALYALLMNSAIFPTMFKFDGAVYGAALLDKLFSRGGDVYDAVVMAAATHFHCVGAACAREEDRVKMLIGLMQLMFLRDRSFVLSTQDVNLISSAQFSWDERPISQLISHAQFWGIHRTIDIDGGRISFAMPSAVLDGLAPALAKWKKLLPVPTKHDSQNGSLGLVAEQKVHAILTFHRLVAALLNHTNWLGLVEDSEDPIALLQQPAVTATEEPVALSPRMWDLPRLPVVHDNGLLRDVDAVRRSITHSDAAHQGKQPNATKKCKPELLGQYLGSLSSSEFHAFSTGPQSSSADFIVRYGNNVSHLQVKDVSKVSLCMILEECGKVAPTARACSELQHTLVFILAGQAVRTETNTMIGHLSTVELAQKLEDELQDWETVDSQAKEKSDNAESELKRMRQAIDLVRNGALNVVVLDDIQYQRFSRFHELTTKHLLGGGPY